MSISKLKQDLSDLEAKHAAAVAHKREIVNQLRIASAKTDTGDQKALLSQPRINRELDAASLAISSAEGHVAEARRRLELGENQAREIASIAAAANAPVYVGAARLFEVKTPDGRIVRHRAADAEALQSSLREGYVVTAQIYGAASDGTGGFSIASGTSKEALLEALR